MPSRPASGRSRNAWDQDGVDAAHAPDPEALYGTVDDMPAGMEQVHRIGESGEDGVVVEQQRGCWYSFTRGIRGLWATRLTEDTKTDRELYVRTTLRELVIYIVFLVILSVLTFGMTHSSMYYYTKVMSELFLDGQFPDTRNTFRGMTHPVDFWRFVETPLLDGLYWEEWYNGQNVTEYGYIYFENKLLGVPRVRQLKVRNDSCTVHEDFQKEIAGCYDVYSKAVEDKDSYGPMRGTPMHKGTPDNPASQRRNESAWVYHSEEELDGSSHWGLLSTYGGGGFYQDLATTKRESRALFDSLKSNLWLDRGTRAVFFDFTVYNANINLFCVIKLLVEFPATGGVIPSWSFRTVKLIRYVTVRDYFVLACEVIFILFILYYTIEESIEIRHHKCAYFKSFWNILDVIVILISILCIAFSCYRYIVVDRMLTELLENKDSFANFEFLGFWQTQFNNVVAMAVFFAWIKTFKYISFNKTMTQLSSTLSRCAKDIGGFAIMFCIIFFAFAQLGYLIFGTQVKDFSTFGNAAFTLLRIVLGDFDFHELEQANRVLGPLYFCSYVFFVFFVLLNMFLAIINDTYSEVKAEIAQQKNEFEIGDYFKKGYQRMMNKLSSKRDRIIDIQKALQKADINSDKILDFDEWRQELKARGYADAEIETVFAKYDLDGDRVLDEAEQKQMMADLEGQKDDVNKEMENAGKGSRPRSGKKKDGKSTVSFEDDSDTESGARIANGVSYEEFDVLTRRVDRMEHSIGSIVSKIDAVLVKLEAMEKAKLKHKEKMGKMLSNISENGGTSDKEKREQMEMLVRDELEKWDEASSPGGSAKGGRSPRPGSDGGSSSA